ncbi:hypothetical protein RI129_000884 [Pyrocoelia pectoralis]|uniref:Beta-glucosidase n=1 Tax=Pyrocoelia pectoralis TaxID=417401 RepID=A0AAN7VIU7_9COLE
MKLKELSSPIPCTFTNIWIILFAFLSTSSGSHFPKNFKFGVSTASYQIEGAWNVSGKGENIWDRMTHEHPNWIEDRTNGDVACDSYHQWKTDIELINNLGVDFYRFSLSWSRLLPTGFSNYVNPDGVRYYNGIINELLKNNIEPIITIYHWDLPQPIQNEGGWPNIVTAEYFADYAKVAFELFGDRVKTWITFNEPIEICQNGYGGGGKAPRIFSSGVSDYLCGRTLLMAHAKVFHLYDRHYRHKQQGKIGVTINTGWFEPKSNDPKDVAAAELSLQMMFGWWTNPIFSKTGDYPLLMKDRIANISRAQHFKRSRLPNFNNEEIKFIQGTSDFLGLNHYSTVLASYAPLPNVIPVSFSNDLNVKTEVDPKWIPSAATWIHDVPWGFRKLLNWIKGEYNNPPVFVTENGYPDVGQFNDMERIHYLQGYLDELLKAILVDDCNVYAYSVWSVLDNMEWNRGYTLKFGLYHVNFTDPKRKRSPKSSVQFYKDFIKSSRKFDSIEMKSMVSN